MKFFLEVLKAIFDMLGEADWQLEDSEKYSLDTQAMPNTLQSPEAQKDFDSLVRFTAVKSTLLKQVPGEAAGDFDSVEIAESEELQVTFHVIANELNHYFIVLPSGASWWVYAPHWRVEGTEAGNNPVESSPNNTVEPEEKEVEAEPEKIPEVKRIQVPGITQPVRLDAPIYYQADGKPSNFTWAEATKNGERIPASETITANIIKTARYMDKVRKYLGDKAIMITSWYRDPATNRYWGGARNSQHLQGNAIDFCVIGMDLVDVFYALKEWPEVPTGLAVGDGFCHIDLRPGGFARWHYRGGPNVSLW